MIITGTHSQLAVPQAVAKKRYAGEVVYVYAYDVAYEMSREPVRELLGQPVKPFEFDKSKRSPRQLFFFRPQTIVLPSVGRVGPHGPVCLERVVKIVPVGALRIAGGVPFGFSGLQGVV